MVLVNVVGVRAGTVRSYRTFSKTSRVKNSVRKRTLVRAKEEGPDAFPVSMTTDEAYAVLGVTKESPFDEVLNAKNSAMSAFTGDQEKIIQVEVAYDLILAQSMKRRLGGDVSNDIRFADVPRKKPAPQKAAPKLLQKLPGGVSVQTPPNNTLIKQGAVFGVLAAWTLFQGLSQPPGSNETPGFQLALAVAAAVYFFRENKKVNLAPSVSYTVAGLVAGAVLGTVIQNWVRVDIVPIGGLSSPAVFVSEFALLGLWLACTFLG